MLRKLILVGVFAGASASAPILYQTNPEAFEGFVRGIGQEEQAEPAPQIALARPQIGRIDVSDVQAVVLEDEALSGTLVGMSFLNRLRKYHVENGALILEQ